MFRTSEGEIGGMFRTSEGEIGGTFRTSEGEIGGKLRTYGLSKWVTKHDARGD